MSHESESLLMLFQCNITPTSRTVCPDSCLLSINYFYHPLPSTRLVNFNRCSEQGCNTSFKIGTHHFSLVRNL